MHTKNQSSEKKNKKIKRLLRRLILILVGIALGLDVYFANAGTVLGNQLPMPFGYGIANVLSGSMEPTFSKGTLLLVKETQDVSEGDIVVYQSGKELIVHRVIQVSDEQVVTQGDANNTADVPFDKTQIKGRVIGWVPVLGGAVSVLKTPAAMILMLVCALLLIEGSFRVQKDADNRELEDIKAEIRRLKAEKGGEQDVKKR